MVARHRLRNFFLLTTLALVADTSAGCLGCAGSPESPDADTLRLQFTEQSARVLDSEWAFSASATGFAVAVTKDSEIEAPRGLQAALPTRGADPVHFAVGSFAVDVREAGATGEGELAGSAVAYERTGGKSYWTATKDGHEEWL